MDEAQHESERRLTFGSRRRRYIALALNVCFFAFLAYWLRRNVNFDDIATHLRQIPPRAIFVAMATNSAALFLFGLRLAAILGAKTLPCFLISVIGMTFNSLLPFRLGEGVRIYCGNAIFNLPIGGLGAALVMEKLYDLSALLLLVATVALTTDSSIVAAARPFALTLGVALPLCGLLILRARAIGAITPPSAWKLLKKYRLDHVARQAETLFARQEFARPVLLTLLIWTANVCVVLFFFSAVAPEMRFGVLDAMTLMTIAALAIALPFSPAGLGVFEAGIAAYLTSVHGVQTEKAISAALAYHFSITAPHNAMAAIFYVSLLLRSSKART